VLLVVWFVFLCLFVMFFRSGPPRGGAVGTPGGIRPSAGVGEGRIRQRRGGGRERGGAGIQAMPESGQWLKAGLARGWFVCFCVSGAGRGKARAGEERAKCRRRAPGRGWVGGVWFWAGESRRAGEGQGRRVCKNTLACARGATGPGVGEKAKVRRRGARAAPGAGGPPAARWLPAAWKTRPHEGGKGALFCSAPGGGGGAGFSLKRARGLQSTAAARGYFGASGPGPFPSVVEKTGRGGGGQGSALAAPRGWQSVDGERELLARAKDRAAERLAFKARFGKRGGHRGPPPGKKWGEDNDGWAREYINYDPG